MARAFAPEQALLQAAALRPLSGRRIASIREAATAAIDWDHLVRLVRRHRMAGVTLDALSVAGVKLPSDVEATLRDMMQADLVQALTLTREAGRLVDLLKTNDIRCVVLKGPPLAMLAYGSLALRQIRDLDLLVSPGDLPRSLELVRTRGYLLHQEGSDAELRPDRSALIKDVVLVHEETGTIVELHCRISENIALLSDTVSTSARPVKVGAGVELPALVGEPLLLYLMVHGFRHGWSRLKWLADVAILIQAMPERDVSLLLENARRQGIMVIVASTLLIVEQMFGLETLDLPLRRYRRGRRVRLCAAIGIRRLTDPREPEDQIRLIYTTSASMLLASPNPRYVAHAVLPLFADKSFILRFGGSMPVIASSVVLRPFLFFGRLLSRFQNRAEG